MILVLGLMVLVVPLMRLKDLVSERGMTFKDLWSAVKGYDFNKLKGVSLSQLVAYFKELLNVPNSHDGFQEFDVDDSSEQVLIYNLIEKYLGVVWE